MSEQGQQPPPGGQQPPPPGGQQPQREPTEEELREAFSRIRVRDVLLQTVVTLVNVGGHRLTEEGQKDPEEARQAIEAVGAMLPLCPQDEVRPVRDALSQLQMLYVRETGQPEPGAHEPAGGEAAEQAGGEAGREDEERARARSRIWTPPGT